MLITKSNKMSIEGIDLGYVDTIMAQVMRFYILIIKLNKRFSTLFLAVFSERNRTHFFYVSTKS